MKRIFFIIGFVLIAWVTGFCQSRPLNPFKPKCKDTSQVTDIQRVVISETDTTLLYPVEGLLVFKREGCNNKYLSKVFVLKNGDYIEIKPVSIKYTIINNKCQR